jgi:hypothetical protein
MDQRAALRRNLTNSSLSRPRSFVTRSCCIARKQSRHPVARPTPPVAFIGRIWLRRSNRSRAVNDHLRGLHRMRTANLALDSCSFFWRHLF